MPLRRQAIKARDHTKGARKPRLAVVPLSTWWLYITHSSVNPLIVRVTDAKQHLVTMMLFPRMNFDKIIRQL
jgi:hypothetical protein